MERFASCNTLKLTLTQRSLKVTLLLLWHSFTAHQSLASLAPTCLTTDMHLVSEYGRRPQRSTTDRTLTVPRTDNRFGDRSFAVTGPRLWNSLPICLRQISSFGQFRRYLKDHLFGIWEITAQCATLIFALYKYFFYLLTYLLTWLPVTFSDSFAGLWQFLCGTLVTPI